MVLVAAFVFLTAFTVLVLVVLKFSVGVILETPDVFDFEANDDVSKGIETVFKGGAARVTILAAAGVGVRLQYQCPCASAQAWPSAAVPYVSVVTNT